MTHTEVTFDTFPLAFIGRDQGGLFIDGDWIESKDLSDEGVKYLTTGNVGVGEFKEQGSGFISEETFVKLRCTEVLPGDILISRLNLPVGRACIVPDLRHRLVTSVDNVIVRPSASFDRRYLVFLLSTPHHLESTSNLARGTTMQRISRSALGRIRLAIPDLATQRQIADFLDRETARIDLLIEKKQRLVASLGEKTAETIRQCVSWGMDSSVPKKPSRVPAADDLAAHWTEQRLSTICRFVQGKAHEPFIEDDGEYICVTARFVSTSGEKFRRCTKNLTPGKVNDIAMVMSDLPNGRALARAFLVDQDDLYAINQRVCAITVMEGDPRFFYYQLDRNFQLLRYNDGFNQTHLPNRAFTQLFLKVPPIEEQKRIADYLEAVSMHTKTVTEKTNTSIDRLKEYRSALITAAVTGQIDVSTYAKSGAPDRRLDAIQEEMGA